MLKKMKINQTSNVILKIKIKKIPTTINIILKQHTTRIKKLCSKNKNKKYIKHYIKTNFKKN